MAQQIIVYIIGGLLASYVAWRTYLLLQGKAKDPCAGCGGCPQRDELLKKQKECAAKNKETGSCKAPGSCGCN